MEIKLEDILRTEFGQSLVTQLLREACEPIFKRLLNEEHIVSNIVWHMVNHCTNVETERLEDKIAVAVQQKLSGNPLEYFNQNKVLQRFIDEAIVDNKEVVNRKVLEQLENDDNYDNIAYSLGKSLLETLKKGA